VHFCLKKISIHTYLASIVDSFTLSSQPTELSLMIERHLAHTDIFFLRYRTTFLCLGAPVRNSVVFLGDFSKQWNHQQTNHEKHGTSPCARSQQMSWVILLHLPGKHLGQVTHCSQHSVCQATAEVLWIFSWGLQILGSRRICKYRIMKKMRIHVNLFSKCLPLHSLVLLVIEHSPPPSTSRTFTFPSSLLYPPKFIPVLNLVLASKWEGNPAT
jgi:hypothetical protein